VKFIPETRRVHKIRFSLQMNKHERQLIFTWLGFGFMVFDSTFNNISIISWRSVLLVEETGWPRENQATDKL